MTEQEANKVFNDMTKAARQVLHTVFDDVKWGRKDMIYGYVFSQDTAPYLATILRLSETIARLEEQIQALEFKEQDKK